MALGVIIGFVKMIVGFLLGPAVLFFGPDAQKAIICMQSFLGSGLSELLAAMSAATWMTLPKALESGFFCMLGGSTMTLAILSMGDKGIAALQGAVTGSLIVTPVVSALETAMYDFAECQVVGDPTEEYPKGAWLGCDEDNFIVAVWIMKLIAWAGVLGSAKIGMGMQELMAMLASGMMGASMVIAAFMEPIFNILMAVDKDAAIEAQVAIAAVKIPLVYCMAAFGFKIMRDLKKNKENPDGPSGIAGKIEKRSGFAKPLLKLNAIVEKLMKPPPGMGPMQIIKQELMGKAKVAKSAAVVPEVSPTDEACDAKAVDGKPESPKRSNPKSPEVEIPATMAAAAAAAAGADPALADGATAASSGDPAVMAAAATAAAGAADPALAPAASAATAGGADPVLAATAVAEGKDLAAVAVATAGTEVPAASVLPVAEAAIEVS